MENTQVYSIHRTLKTPTQDDGGQAFECDTNMPGRTTMMILPNKH